MLEQNRAIPVQITISDLAVGIFVDDPKVRETIAARYRPFLEPASHDIDIFLDLQTGGSKNFLISPKIWGASDIIIVAQSEFSGTIDIRNKIGRLTSGSHMFLECLDYYLRVAFGVLAAAKGGFIFHCAAVARAGQGHIFFGVSGSGKTTVASLSGNHAVLNDDLNYLRKNGDKWVAHATPFWNPTQTKPIPGEAPIAGMYRLIQDTHVFTRRMTPTIATAEIIANIPVVSLIPELGQEIVTIAIDLATSVPCYELHFQKNDAFWGVIP